MRPGVDSGKGGASAASCTVRLARRKLTKGMDEAAAMLLLRDVHLVGLVDAGQGCCPQWQQGEELVPLQPERHISAQRVRTCGGCGGCE